MIEWLVEPPAEIMIFNSPTGMLAGFLKNPTWDLKTFQMSYYLFTLPLSYNVCNNKVLLCCDLRTKVDKWLFC